MSWNPSCSEGKVKEIWRAGRNAWGMCRLMGIIMVSENNGTGSFILQNNWAMLLCSCSENESVRKFVCRSYKTDTRSKIFEDVLTWMVFEICSTFQLLDNFAKQFREAALRFSCLYAPRSVACPHGTTRFPRKDVPDSRHCGLLLKLSMRPNCRWNLTKITDALYDGLTNILLMITFVTKFYRFSYFYCIDLCYKGDLSYKIYIVARFLCLSEDTRRLSLCGY